MGIMQGENDAGQSWYIRVRAVCEAYDLIPCPAEIALFALIRTVENERQILLVAGSVDDFACAYSHEHLFAGFKAHMDRYVPTTVQTGQVLKYLNQRVV